MNFRLFFLLLVIAVAVVGCQSTNPGMGPFQEHMKPYIVPKFLGSVSEANTVIDYDKEGGVTKVTLPNEVIKNDELTPFTDDLAKVDFEKKTFLNVGAAVQFIQDPVKLKGDYEKTTHVTFVARNYKAMGFTKFSVEEWFRKHPQFYERFKNYFFVIEVLEASNIEYTFVDASGTELEVSTDKFKDIFGEAGVHTKYTTWGKYTLVRKEPLVIGYKVIRIQKLATSEGKEDFKAIEVEPNKIYERRVVKP